MYRRCLNFRRLCNVSNCSLLVRHSFHYYLDDTCHGGELNWWVNCGWYLINDMHYYCTERWTTRLDAPSKVVQWRNAIVDGRRHALRGLPRHTDLHATSPAGRNLSTPVSQVNQRYHDQKSSTAHRLQLGWCRWTITTPRLSTAEMAGRQAAGQTETWRRRPG